MIACAIVSMRAGTNQLLAEACQGTAFLATPFAITTLVTTVAALLTPTP